MNKPCRWAIEVHWRLNPFLCGDRQHLQVSCQQVWCSRWPDCRLCSCRQTVCPHNANRGWWTSSDTDTSPPEMMPNIFYGGKYFPWHTCFLVLKSQRAMVPLANPIRSLDGSAGFSANFILNQKIREEKIESVTKINRNLPTMWFTAPGWLLNVTPIALFQLIT